MEQMVRREVDRRRRRFLLAATSVVGGIGVAVAAAPFIRSMEPSARARAAAAPVEVDLGKIEPGMQITVAWRSKPVWVLHRTPAMISSLGGHDALLLDPDSETPQQPPYCANATRSIKPEYFVAVGICTHLGCIPTFRPQPGASDLGNSWPGGYFCPCHQSKYDLAGRVFKDMPAPRNLLVPPNTYLSPTRLQIGEETT
jgi:ubiquinol-cytochrome c reductase iron-sulfur subunit